MLEKIKIIIISTKKNIREKNFMKKYLHPLQTENFARTNLNIVKNSTFFSKI